MNNKISDNGAGIKTGTPGLVRPYTMDVKDGITALVALGLGFLFVEWGIPFPYAPNMGVFIFFTIIVITASLYFKRPKENKIPSVKKRQSEWVVFGVAILSMSYFLIFDNTPLNSFMFLFTMLSLVVWIMKKSETSITEKLNGFILGDLLNQILIIPLSNYLAIFHSFTIENRFKKSTLLSLVVGIIVSIPLIIAVTTLLSQAGTGFNNLVEDVLDMFYELDFVHYAMELLFGIPIACYFFGFIYGNHRKRKTEIITYEKTNSRFIKLHVIPGAAVYGPLVILNIIYIIFFVAMAGYFFSAFSGSLPMEMTYAEYARQGFFELCAVATINLAIIVFSYTYLKRDAYDYPKLLRILSGLMSFFTILLVSTAMSKMLMYISSYGLTRLRIYTLWFMLLILFVFLLIGIWHIKKFNLGKPIIIGFVVLFLALGFSNSDGIIAKYNIKAYESGKIKQLDTEVMYDLSDAVVPYVYDYLKDIEDANIKKELESILYFHETRYDEIILNEEPEFYDYRDNKIMRFNIQSYIAKNVGMS